MLDGWTILSSSQEGARTRMDIDEGRTARNTHLDQVADYGEYSTTEWLSLGALSILTTQEMPRQSRVGIDPEVLSFAESRNLSTEFEKAKRDVTLVPVKENLVDQVWNTKPSRPSNPIFRLDEKYTGASVSSKLQRLREQLAKVGSPGLVVSQLDEVAWLLNLRGSDIPYNPVGPLTGGRGFED
jgi:hypothetical protein